MWEDYSYIAEKELDAEARRNDEGNLFVYWDSNPLPAECELTTIDESDIMMGLKGKRG